MLNQFKKARLISGMQQRELAKKLGVSQVTVSSWERGKAYPNAKRIQQVADALGTTAERLLDEPDGREVS